MIVETMSERLPKNGSGVGLETVARLMTVDPGMALVAIRSTTWNVAVAPAANVEIVNMTGDGGRPGWIGGWGGMAVNAGPAVCVAET
jgi:hypothetical protein